MYIQLVGPVWSILAYFYYFGRVAVVSHVVLVVAETFLIRLLIDKAWKRLPPISDEFFAFFLPILNLLFGIWIAWQQLATNERGVLIYR